MTYENESLLLRYEAYNLSRKGPSLQLLILKDASAVIYRNSTTLKNLSDPEDFVAISPYSKALVQGLFASESDRLYHLGELEHPEENWGGVHTYAFYFLACSHRIEMKGRELEYIVGKPSCPNVNYVFDLLKRIGEILIPEGVPEECFAPAHRSLAAPIVQDPKRVVDSFTIYDFQTRGAEPRSLEGGRERLERYAFGKCANGSYTLEIQAGWSGGTGHWDGASASYPLPTEWFSGTIEQFLSELTAKYPAGKYGFSRDELLAIPGLPKFLGF